MNNIKYITQKITFFGINESTEDIAKLYLLGIGFDNVYNSSNEEDMNKFKSKYNKHIDKVAGIPDLLAVKDNNITFIEVKKIKGKYKDSLSHQQLNWIENHPEFNVIILYLEYDIKQNEMLHISELKNKIKELEEAIFGYREELFFIDERYPKLRYEICNKLRDVIKLIEENKLDYDKEEMRKGW